ncbi:hypothetical protein O6H91_06G051400 [Diphasiastrum complanatum]|nr:hypothetical protein O6H91_06G051400 [Diphasiastrum complanatum]
MMDPEMSQVNFRATTIDADRSCVCPNSLSRTSSVSSPGSISGIPSVAAAAAGSSTGSSCYGNFLWNVVGESLNCQLIEEDSQLQLALARRFSAASAAMDDPDFSLIGNTRALAGGRRVETMEYRYWVTNCLSYEDRIDDGFYDIWGMSPYVWSMCTDSNELGHMPLLDELRSVHPSSDLSIEVVLVDRKTDPDLRELEDEVLRMAYSSDEIADLASKLGKLVANVMGGSVLTEEDLLEGWLIYTGKLMQLSGSIVLPIGALRQGLCRHRALLFKVLADSVGLPCRLVRGNSYCSKFDAGMAVVKDSDDRECMVDLYNEPGLLLPLDERTVVPPAVIAPPLQFESSSPFVGHNSKVKNQFSCDLRSRLDAVNRVGYPLVNLTELPNYSVATCPYRRNAVESHVALTAAQDLYSEGKLEDKAYQRFTKLSGKERDDARSQRVSPKVPEAVRISKLKYLSAECQKPCNAERIASNMVWPHDHPGPEEDRMAGVHKDMNVKPCSLVTIIHDTNSIAGSKLTTDAKAENRDTTRSHVGTFSRDVNERLSSENVHKAGKMLDWVSNDFEIQWHDILLGERIGQGSYGKVYRADWQGSDVAVKIFLDQDFKEEALEEFRREVAIMRRLRHPNIILFMGAVTKPPNLSILTEFCPRGSLYRLLHRTDREVDERRRIRMALDIAKGLNYLHRSSPPVVHRDLKSPNLLVDKYWTVKVCDFGLSQMKHNTFLTSKSGAGTPEWMAPEVLRNEPSDEKSDVYSFGVILWELATLQQPWAALSPIQVVGAVGFQHRRLPIPDNVDPEIANIIHACWFSDPKSRPAFYDIMQKLKLLQRLTLSQPNH